MPDPTITSMTPAACRTLTAAMKDALAYVEETYGVTIEFRGGTYDPVAGTLKPKITVSVGDAETAERNAFAANARLFGLKPEDYGVTFTRGLRSYRLVGLSPRSRRYPLIAVSLDDGKTYKLSENTMGGLDAIGRVIQRGE